MKVIIAGSRSITDYELIKRAIVGSRFAITEVVSGGARGVDRLGERWAAENGIPVIQFIPDWDTLGKKAGYARNADMANYAEALIAVYDGASKGTGHMIDIATRKKLKVFVYNTQLIYPQQGAL